MKLYLATKNAHKVDELRNMMKDSGISVEPLSNSTPEAPEDGLTFEENAVQKSQFYAQFVEGFVLADDSGLTVPVLNGEPGVFSARYAGVHGDDAANNQKLIANLHSKNVTEAPAAFVCHLALSYGNTVLLSVEGRVDGTVYTDLRGTQGFGYDPLFVPVGSNKRFAEMTLEEKALFSHRGNALKAAYPRLVELLKQ